MSTEPRSLRLRTDELSWRRVDDEIVVLDMRSSAYYAVNGTGATLWEHLQAGCDRDQLVQAVVAEHDISLQESERDVDAFVAMLTGFGFLEE